MPWHLPPWAEKNLKPLRSHTHTNHATVFCSSCFEISTNKRSGSRRCRTSISEMPPEEGVDDRRHTRKGRGGGCGTKREAFGRIPSRRKSSGRRVIVVGRRCHRPESSARSSGRIPNEGKVRRAGLRNLASDGYWGAGSARRSRCEELGDGAFDPGDDGVRGRGRARGHGSASGDRRVIGYA